MDGAFLVTAVPTRGLEEHAGWRIGSGRLLGAARIMRETEIRRCPGQWYDHVKVFIETGGETHRRQTQAGLPTQDHRMRERRGACGKDWRRRVMGSKRRVWARTHLGTTRGHEVRLRRVGADARRQGRAATRCGRRHLRQSWSLIPLLHDQG